MEAQALFAALIVVSIIIVAIALRRSGMRDSTESGIVRRAFHFAGGPFPLSIAIHLAALLFLIVTVHETRGRNIISSRAVRRCVHTVGWQWRRTRR